MDTFQNPPITEALIDFKVDFSRKLSETDLDLSRFVSKEYPNKKKQYQSKLHFVLGKASATTEAGEVVGILHISTDEKRIIQSKIEGYTYNVLAPYPEKWENWVPEGKKMWSKYADHLKPDKVTRIATKFINMVKIPERKKVNLEDYFTIYPTVPEGLPQSVNSFFYRVTLDYADDHAEVVVTMTPAKIQDSRVFPFIVDIDAYVPNVEYDPKDDKVWSALDRLREIKNEVFDKIMTGKAKELFE